MKVEGLMSKSGKFSKELYPILRKKTEVLGIQSTQKQSLACAQKTPETSLATSQKARICRRPGSSSFLSQSRQDRDRALLSKDKVPSSLDYHSQFAIIHRASPSYTIAAERPAPQPLFDDRPALNAGDSQSETKGFEFKKQLPRPPIADPSRVNEHRFATLSVVPNICTKVRRVQTPSFAKQRTRPRLFVNTPSLLLSYSPKFSQVEADLGKNGLDMARASGRKSLALMHVHDLQYARPKSAEKHVGIFKLEKSASRPELSQSMLPLYMRRVPSRLGVTCVLDKSLVMNSTLPGDSELDSSGSEFSP